MVLERTPLPFESRIPRNLTTGEIHSYAPPVAGVYGISNPREWLYIGVSENIQSTLLNHLRESSTLLTKQRATGFVFEVCDGSQRQSRQDRLVSEYKPSGNLRAAR